MATTARRRAVLRSAAALLALVATLLLASGCGVSADPAGPDDEPSDTLAIGYQAGLGYAPLLIAKQEGWLEEDLPGVDVEFRELASGSAIRDGMLSGDIQAGALGLGPFLVGRSAGIEWKMLTAFGDANLFLMADPGYDSLADLPDDAKVAVPAPDSIQAVVLRRAADEELGDSEAFDEKMVSLAHPDALQALLSGQVTAHLASPPFQGQEQAEGEEPIVESYDLFGEHTFNSLFVLENYHDANPEQMQALDSAIQRGIDMINENPDRAAEILAEEGGGDPTAEVYREQLDDPNVSFTREPHGLMEFAEFMNEVGLTETVPSGWRELVFDELGDVQGS